MNTEPRKLVSQELLLFNGYQPNNILLRSGVVDEENENEITWSVESECCNARWSDGRTTYGVRLEADGRWTWSVSEYTLDAEDDWCRERTGKEDSYAAALSHLSAFITHPDHTEELSFRVYRDPMHVAPAGGATERGDQDDFYNPF